MNITGKPSEPSHLERLEVFYGQSLWLLAALYRLAELPSDTTLPMPKWPKATRAVAMQAWQAVHPKNFAYEVKHLTHIITCWLLAADLCNTPSAKDELKADVLNITNIFGRRDGLFPPDFSVLGEPDGTEKWEKAAQEKIANDPKQWDIAARTVFSFARDKKQIGIREFEACLSRIRRHIAVEAVRAGKTSTDAPASPALDELTDKIVKAVEAQPGKLNGPKLAKMISRAEATTDRHIRKAKNAGKIKRVKGKQGYHPA